MDGGKRRFHFGFQEELSFEGWLTPTMFAASSDRFTSPSYVSSNKGYDPAPRATHHGLFGEDTSPSWHQLEAGARMNSGHCVVPKDQKALVLWARALPSSPSPALLWWQQPQGVLQTLQKIQHITRPCWSFGSSCLVSQAHSHAAFLWDSPASIVCWNLPQ